jgi:hypothetical protein
MCKGVKYLVDLRQKPYSFLSIFIPIGSLYISLIITIILWLYIIILNLKLYNIESLWFNSVL